MIVEPKSPAVVLEDLEDYLEYVQCSKSGILVKFRSTQHLATAQKEWIMSEFIVVTSHQGCSPDAERAPYLYVYRVLLQSVFALPKILIFLGSLELPSISDILPRCCLQSTLVGPSLIRLWDSNLGLQIYIVA